MIRGKVLLTALLTKMFLLILVAVCGSLKDADSRLVTQSLQEERRSRRLEVRSRKPIDKQRGEMPWVDPRTEGLPGTKYKTFYSSTFQGDVSYLIYLPRNYEENLNKRYPVVYWLHGGAANPRQGVRFVHRLDNAIESGAAPEMIVVLVNGKGGSLFRDSKDGKAPVETVIIKDLTPPT
jgi:enterochelin esterase-like enzyme